VPSKIAAKGQLRLASIHLSIDNQRRPLGQVTAILTRGACILPKDELHEEEDHDNEENSADIEDALSNSPGDNLSEPELTTQSELVSMRKMMEEQREMFNNDRIHNYVCRILS
jgi:hypothetical protein